MLDVEGRKFYVVDDTKTLVVIEECWSNLIILRIKLSTPVPWTNLSPVKLLTGCQILLSYYELLQRP